MTGAHIRAIRVALKMTQEDFADELGVATNTVWRWEHGQLKLSERTRKQIRTLCKFRGLWEAVQ